MRISAESVAPTGVERAVPASGLLVSKTDLQGRVTYANDAFLAVSGFSEDELLGRPHNVVRHPEMPRAMFRLLWATISAGEELFAYVVNLAADGAHYWVLAHVTPTFHRAGSVVGFHSSRRAASRAAVEQVTGVYGALLAEEVRHDNAQDSAEAGMCRLEELLVERGLTYDEYVWSLVHGRAVA